MTVGGVIYQAGQRNALNQCDFGALPFARETDERYDIIEPKLTLKERLALNEQLPAARPTLEGVPQGDVDAYSANYRFFPFFVESEM